MNKRTKRALQTVNATVSRRNKNRPFAIERLADLSGHQPTTCQFIMGDRYMCGAESLPGKAYCEEHWALTHKTEEAA